MRRLLLTIILVALHAIGFSQGGSELIFMNPVLESGINNKQGAVYRFANVKTGVDATIRLKRFSRSDIHMATIDNAVFGWPKAFQPEFGLAGNVPPNQNWYIDFEVTFYVAGTNTRVKLDTIDFTALDVDGDNVTLSEYVVYDRPNSIVLATTTALTTSPEGLLGSVATCADDNIASTIITCTYCSGSGVLNDLEDTHCDGMGKVHSQCLHPYLGGTGTGMYGPVMNFTNIDTSASMVMSIYRYLNRDRINFRYGAKTGVLTTNAGIRLNSMWFRRFRIDQMYILKSKVSNFTANKSNNYVDLRWTIPAEEGIKNYVVEKSSDGKSYKECTVVTALNQGSNNYQVTDYLTGNEKGLLFYRIRNTEFSGDISYSETRVIRMHSSGTDGVKVNTYPNPVTSDLRISIPDSWQKQRVVYQIMTTTGNKLYQKEVAAANQTEQISLANLAPGVYTLQVNCNGTHITSRFVKH
ncbi:T9SS type A sorting domain-containing protein [Lacibacter sp. MH-610]|uniref:T9SS type A sorting domain-containing protein n=1 Tax=Lacibacter sp. MH-610 TaxID=3020883 RepID=UPI0038928FAD